MQGLVSLYVPWIDPFFTCNVPDNVIIGVLPSFVIL